MMAMQFLVPVGVLIVGGFLAAMWMRQRQPVRLRNDKPRIPPTA